VTAADAFTRLVTTLRGVAGVRVYVDVAQSVDPPAMVVPPPTLTFDVYGPQPTEATFKVPLIVRGDSQETDDLLALLPVVAQAVHDSDDAALTAAEPGSWGSPPLPCYLLTIEVSV
jgi:hypothetical protein